MDWHIVDDDDQVVTEVAQVYQGAPVWLRGEAQPKHCRGVLVRSTAQSADDEFVRSVSMVYVDGAALADFGVDEELAGAPGGETAGDGH